MPTRRQHGTRWISTRAMSTRRLPATPAEHRQRQPLLLPADSADHDFWRSGAASISYSVGSGHPAGPRQPTSGTRSPTVPGNLRASGLLPRSSRACSPAGTAGLGHPPMESIQRASAWAGRRDFCCRVRESVPDQQRASSGASDARMISYAKGAGKSKGKSFARTLPAAKPPGWTRKLYGTAFGVVVGSAGHSSGTSSSSGRHDATDV